MAKFRTVEEKRKLVLFILSTQPKWQDRIFELRDEQILDPNRLNFIYRYEPLWAVIDAYKGKPLKPRMVCDMWNKLAEAYCNGNHK